MDFAQIVREYFPDATDEFVDWFAWSRTSYPCEKQSEDDIRTSLLAYRNAKDSSIFLCEFCDNITQKDGLCKTCHGVLHPGAENR